MMLSSPIDDRSDTRRYCWRSARHAHPRVGPPDRQNPHSASGTAGCPTQRPSNSHSKFSLNAASIVANICAVVTHTGEG
jgi:hypothetical protein